MKDNATQAAVFSDSTITTEEMIAYGYLWKGMIPLNRKKAYEAFYLGYPVYLLYENNTETLVKSIKQMVAHEGIYGIERTSV